MPDQDQLQTINGKAANQVRATPQPADSKPNPPESGQNESISGDGKNTGGSLKGIALLEIGLFELLFVIGGLLIILGLLNYYNVLPVSRSFPFLSFLPQKQKVIENKTQAKPAIIVEEIDNKLRKTLPFSGCPLKAEICSTAEIIKEESTQSSNLKLKFGNVSEGTEILAALDGTLSTDDSRIVLANKDRLIKAYYEFEKGSFNFQASSSASILQGEILGKITKESDLNFYIINTITGNAVSIRPRPDGQYLLYTGQ